MKIMTGILLTIFFCIISCGKSSTSESEIKRAEKKIEVERNANGNEIDEKKITIEIKSPPVDVNTDMLLVAKKLLQDTVRQKPHTTFNGLVRLPEGLPGHGVVFLTNNPGDNFYVSAGDGRGMNIMYSFNDYGWTCLWNGAWQPWERYEYSRIKEAEITLFRGYVLKKLELTLSKPVQLEMVEEMLEYKPVRVVLPDERRPIFFKYPRGGSREVYNKHKKDGYEIVYFYIMNIKVLDIYPGTKHNHVAIAGL